MTQLEISTVLQIIEDWIAQPPEAKLGKECRQSGIDFSYMTGRGVNAGYLAKLIIDSTGYNPRQLCLRVSIS